MPRSTSVRRHPLRKKLVVFCASAVGALLLLAPAAEARKGQRGHHQMTPDERDAFRAEMKQKVEKHVRTELAPRLQLDDTQTEKLLTAMQASHEEKRAARQALKASVKKLDELTQSGADDATLKAQMDIVREQKKIAEDTDLLERTAAFLSVKQQAQLMAELPKLKRQAKRGMKRAWRQKHKERRAPQGQRGPGARGGR